LIYRAGSLPESSRTRPTAPGRQRESEAGPGRKADYRCAGPADQSQLSAIRGQTASTQNVNGYPLAYSVRSKGPSVVFVGGVLTDYRIWSRGQALRESEFRTVAVSPRHFYPEPWRGTGSDFTVAQHAKDLAEFIQDQDGPVFLVGWSYGAQIAFETARARPDLVKKLVLAKAPLYTRLRPRTTARRSSATGLERPRNTSSAATSTVVGIGRDDPAPEHEPETDLDVSAIHLANSRIRVS